MRNELAQSQLFNAFAPREFLELFVGIGHAKATHHCLNRLGQYLPGIRKIFGKFLKFEGQGDGNGGNAVMANNADWLLV